MKMSKLVVGLLVASAVTSANAALDIAAVTTSITDASTAIATIGASVTVLTVGIFVYKWIRRAL